MCRIFNNNKCHEWFFETPVVWAEVVYISYLRRSTVSRSRLPSINLTVSLKQVDGYWTLSPFIPIMLFYVLVAEKRFKQSKFIFAIYPKFIGCKYAPIWFKPASVKLWLPAHTREITAFWYFAPINPRTAS